METSKTETAKACFPRVNKQNGKGTRGSAHCHVILVSEMEDKFVAFLLVFIANLLAVYQLNIFIILLMELS